VTGRRLPVTLERWVAVQQLAAFSRRQWKVAGWSYLAALLIMGVVGETLPGASAGRVVPIQWWPYRGLIALLSIVLLAVTLLIRLRTMRTCQLAPQDGPLSGSLR